MAQAKSVTVVPRMLRSSMVAPKVSGRPSRATATSWRQPRMLPRSTPSAAFRLGEASLIAPLEYTALVWGVILDVTLWGVLPDAMTWVGAAIIVASGLYLLRRERVRAAEAEIVTTP